MALQDASWTGKMQVEDPDEEEREDGTTGSKDLRHSVCGSEWRGE